MKTTFCLLALPFLVATPLFAQATPEGPGDDLIRLFEKMHREGATEDDLRRMLEDHSNKALLDLKIPEAPEDPAAEEDNARLRKELEWLGTHRESFTRPDTGPQPMIGIVVLPLHPMLRNHFGLEKGNGVVVERVLKDRPAAKHGISTNDIVVSADGKKIGSLEALQKAVETAASQNREVELEVIQKGQRHLIKVPIEIPASQPPATGDAGRPAPERRMAEMHRRMERQQREIEELRREIERLKRQFRDEPGE